MGLLRVTLGVVSIVGVVACLVGVHVSALSGDWLLWCANVGGGFVCGCGVARFGCWLCTGDD